MRDKPVTVAHADVDTEHEWVDPRTPDRKQAHHHLTFSRDDIERFRLGYACLRCWELQDAPFPKVENHLPGCAYAPHGMRDHQLEDFAREFKGETMLGPETALEERIAADDEAKAKAAEWRDPKRVQIILPPGVDAP